MFTQMSPSASPGAVCTGSGNEAKAEKLAPPLMKLPKRMVALSENAPAPLVPEPTRTKVMLATSDHSRSASSATAIWMGLNCWKPVTPNPGLATPVARNAYVTVTDVPSGVLQLRLSWVICAPACAQLKTGKLLAVPVVGGR